MFGVGDLMILDPDSSQMGPQSTTYLCYVNKPIELCV